MNKYPNITNWKLREVIDFIEIIDQDSIEYTSRILNELKLQLTINYSGMYRDQTMIDWSKISEYYKFFFDKIGFEEKIKESLEKTELKNVPYLIIPYGKEEPVIKIPTQVFFDDWEGFFRSTHYETIIFSTDFKMIMEVSRDYYLHSNFEIMSPAATSLP